MQTKCLNVTWEATLPGTTILNYESPSALRGGWRRFVKSFAIAISVLACVGPAGLMIYAWFIHAAWLRSGAYARNSFPMGAFAVQMTWVSIVCVFMVAMAWLAAIWWNTYKKAIMTVQTFRELLARRPFKPFRLVMSSGQAYEVRHPEMALLTRSDMLVGTNVEDGVPAEFKICSLLNVATVEPIDQGTAA